MSLQNTRKSGAELGRLLAAARRFFFIGIGGIHMSSLARWALAQGFSVSGSDRTASPLTDALAAEGIRVYIGHDATHIEGADAVIYTLAIEGENPEYKQALAAGIPCLSRADFLGWLMLRYPVRIGVSGAHGKSTVTAMLAEIFSAAGRSPTVFCGAPMPPDGSPLRLGRGEVCIFEACEYGNSFLCFSPTLAVVLNIAHDHADFFPSLEAVEASFSRFAASVGATGAVLFNADDANSHAALGGLAVSRHTFGVGGEYRAENIEMAGGFPCFDLIANGRPLGRIALQVLGRHNLQNALAAAGAAHLAGILDEAIVRGLCGFRGAARRLTLRGRWQGARVFEDYAHHPDEIAAALTALRESMVGQGRLFVVFQSHTYSRTKAFLSEIAAALRLADRVLVADIYPARERDTLGMSAAVIAAAVGACASAEGSFAAITDTLARELAAGDLLAVMGAGDIDGIFGRFSEKGFTI